VAFCFYFSEQSVQVFSFLPEEQTHVPPLMIQVISLPLICRKQLPAETLEISHHRYMTNTVVALQESYSKVITNIKYGPHVTWNEPAALLWYRETTWDYEAL